MFGNLTSSSITLSTVHILTANTYVPCHQNMARPRVADAGDGLHIWRVLSGKEWIRNREEPTRSGPPASQQLLTVKNVLGNIPHGLRSLTDSLERHMVVDGRIVWNLIFMEGWGGVACIYLTQDRAKRRRL